MQQSEYSQLSGLSEAMAKRFQIMDDAISKGTLDKPSVGIFGTYLWLAKFRGEDSHRTLGINFSWGAFLLGPYWYVHFGFIKEAFVILLTSSVIIGLIPPDFPGSTSGASGIFGIFFTGTRYAKYKITGLLSPGGNIFLTMLITVGISIVSIIPFIVINGLLYGWE